MLAVSIFTRAVRTFTRAVRVCERAAGVRGRALEILFVGFMAQAGLLQGLGGALEMFGDDGRTISRRPFNLPCRAASRA